MDPQLNLTMRHKFECLIRGANVAESFERDGRKKKIYKVSIPSWDHQPMSKLWCTVVITLPALTDWKMIDTFIERFQTYKSLFLNIF